MLKLLIRKQLAEIFRGYFFDQKKNSARSKVGMVLMFVLFGILMIGVMGGSLTALSIGLCGGLASAGADWLYFVIMSLISLLLGIFGSVFSTYASLYLSKDNDLLLSMPVPVNDILASRLISVYLMGLLYSCVAVLPAVFVYWVTVSSAAPAVLGGITLILILSLTVMILSCVLGWVVARVSIRLKGKSYVTVLISVALIAAYYFFYFKAQVLIRDIVQNAAVYGARIRGAAGWLFRFGSIGTGDLRAAAVFGAGTAAVLLGILVLLSRSFLKIVTATGSSGKRVSGKQRPSAAAPMPPCWQRSSAASPPAPTIC